MLKLKWNCVKGYVDMKVKLSSNICWYECKIAIKFMMI
jgi:hypothetical protein